MLSITFFLATFREKEKERKSHNTHVQMEQMKLNAQRDRFLPWGIRIETAQS